MKRILKPLVLLSAILSMTAPLQAELYQWTDSRGVIHFTDNLHSVPESVRNSSRLLIRDMDLAAPWPDAPARVEPIVVEPAGVSGPAEPDLEKAGAPVIHYNPQPVEVIVIHPNAHRLKHKRCRFPEGCAPAFRPDPDDRRYVHPSAFNDAPRQYVHPQGRSAARRSHVPQKKR